MPWYIISGLVMILQFIMIVYMRNTYSTSIQQMESQLETMLQSNDRLAASVQICESTAENSINTAEKILADVLETERELRQIEEELAKVGWTGIAKDTATYEPQQLQDIGDIGEDYIMPDDVFDDNINRLLKNAYDCSTGRVCVR